MDNQNPNLTFREFPFSNWILGIIFLGLAATNLPDQTLTAGSADFIFLVIEVAAGLFLILSGSIVTINADRVTQMLTVRIRALLRSSTKEIPFAEIASIQLEMNPASSGRQRGGPTYRVVVINKNGESIPASFFFSSGNKEKNRIVEKLRAFIGVGGDDTGVGNLFQAASTMARQKFQEQQETITGNEAEEHVTDGVHWTLETKAFGGMPVSRWHSPDFKCDGYFLFLVQKVEGQGAPGGLMAKTLYKTSMALFGFSGSLTPNEHQAEMLAPLDPQLENDFSAYTSDSDRARQILNPWSVMPLAAWAQSNPLAKNNRGEELTILFSPEGLYLATMGLTNPEFLDEVAKLGAEMVKAQGGH
jgi:hypothetical protein